MFRSRTRRPALDRRGASLMVVLALLTLFAIVGLSFAMYGSSSATSSRIFREGEDKKTGELPDATDAANLAMQQILFPVDDSNLNALLSALRGHSLAETMYGYNRAGGNDLAYNGIGAYQETLMITGLPPTGIPRTRVINYSLIRNGAMYTLADAEYTRGGTIRENANPAALPAIGTGSVYVGKNANYTYPDRNNLLIGMINPTTGEVVVPSGHRYTLFNAYTPLPDVVPPLAMRLAPPPSVNATSNNGIANPANDDWLRPEGRYLILRPRPFDHLYNSGDGRGLVSDFPYPPPNPDGTYTGDVQNQRYTDGRQRNDSVWLDLNAPVIAWRGKLIKPLFAPLLVPLDGRVNVNVAGNTKNLGSTHGSNQGFGPWEINLGVGTPGFEIFTAANANAIVTKRNNGAVVNGPRGAPTLVNKLFHTDPLTSALVPPYDRSRVDWDAGTSSIVARMAVPTGFSSDPTWPNTLAGPFDNSNATETLNHPALYNPYHWDAFALGTTPTGPGTFPLTDRKQFARYSGRNGLYNNTILGQTAATELAGTGPLDPANSRRSLLTPISNSRNVHNLTPNFLRNDYTLSLLNGLPTFALQATPTVAAAAPQFDFTALANSDGGASTIRNLRAALHNIDLNRPLADYRVDTTLELIDTNVTVASAATAKLDRHLLARDIFHRFAIVTGARISYAGGIVTLPTPTGTGYDLGGTPISSEEYNALRWLAQLAVNIVDYIDNDDISSPFVWNAIDPTDPFSTGGATNNFDPTRIQDRVVFGTEKPRLVLNEVYAEVANELNDVNMMSPASPFKVRFFVEVLNPGSTESAGTKALTGNVQLRQTTNNVPSYRINIYDNASTLVTALTTDPRNITGDAGTPRLQANFTPDITSTSGNISVVEPNDGNYASVAGTNRYGFAVIGPQLGTAVANDPAFVPDATTVPEHAYYLHKPTNVTDALTYDYAAVTQTTFEGGGNAMGTHNFLNANRHAVALQRLANPYLPFDAQTNPYITVDYIGQVYVHDAIRTFNPPVGQMNGQRAAGTPVPTTHYSVGRVQPYTAAELLPVVPTDRTTPPPAANFTQTLLLRQQNLNGTGTPTGKQISLFRHNGSTGATAPPTAPGDNTLRMPFGWLTHLDRRLVSPAELLQVSATPSHNVTHQFATPGASVPSVHFHDLQALNSATLPLYRALDSLTVKPWTHGLPNGGRVPGKVNINMIWDPRVLHAVLDAKTFASGGPNHMTDTEVNAIWTAMTSSAVARNLGTAVGVTLDEEPLTGTDRPIKGLGQATFAPNPGPGAAMPLGSGIDDTIFRAGLGFTMTGSATIPDHPYVLKEPVRKAFNNLTTTSDTFAMQMTVGWFEVRNPTPHSVTNPTILGKEVYDKVPGDMRAQFASVIDRTNLATGLTITGVETGVQAQQDTLWETELVTQPSATDIPGEIYIQFRATGGDDNTIQIHYEGKLITFPGSTTHFRLGTGLNAETVQFTTPRALVGGTNLPAFNPATGIATVKIVSFANPHTAGEAVTGNVKFMNPGPQPAFDVRLPSSQGVVRYWTQLTP